MSLPDRTLCWVQGPPWDRYCQTPMRTEVQAWLDGTGDPDARSRVGDADDGAAGMADMKLWVNADRTVLVRIWDNGTVEVALRDHPDAIWGPPIKLDPELVERER